MLYTAGEAIDNYDARIVNSLRRSVRVLRASLSSVKKIKIMRSFTKVFIAIILVEIILTVNATVLGSRYNDSDCISIVSRKESHYIPYTETYKQKKWGVFYRIQTRVNYKIEYTTVWAMERKCCDGYEEIDHMCKPICKKPCINGICVLPDTCECHPQYAKSQDHECLPECRSDCIHGRCTEPDVCSCDPGYGHPNVSSVSPQSKNLECIPICSEKCEANAHCSAPDTCICNFGYKLNESSNKCEPVCNEPCVNGECVSPYNCQCTSGYEKKLYEPQVCIPKCEQGCVHGTCTEPNTCTCDYGYVARNESFCEPVCSEPCINGTCVAPESCSCNDGYGLLGNSRYVCEPVCQRICNNGACTAPGVCECQPGYAVIYSDESIHLCHPSCKIPCEPFGVCAAVDRCDCFAGYQSIDFDRVENEVIENGVMIPYNVTKETLSACQPICKENCINGKCVEPNICRCNPGYSQSTNGSENICEPVCERPCGGNGTCTSPNVCTCDEGYKLILRDEANACVPKCDVLCGENGTCTAPNVCTCDEGYAKDANGRCVPFCAMPCENGTCVGPNSCRCFDGFTAENESLCVPFCDEGCQNGDCVAPNECRCHEDFIFNANGSTCVTTCTRNCSGHGICVGEKVACECAFGWHGWDCEGATLCVLTMDLGDVNIDRVTVLNETNATLAEARDVAPNCYRCNDSLNNETLCYAVHPDAAVPSVSCFISTESPCYMMHRNDDDSIGVAKLAGPLVAVATVVMACVAAIAYLLYQRRQKEKMNSVIAQTTLFQESVANECLLTEEEVCLQ